MQILFGGFLCALLNLFTTKWLLPATNFMTLFYVGAVTQVLALLLIWWFEEELDVRILSKHKAIKMKNSPKTAIELK